MTDGGWDLPYEDVPGGPVEVSLDHAVTCGGIVVRSIVVTLADEAQTRMPAIVFDFIGVDGRQLRPVLLILDGERLASLPLMFQGAVASAIRAAGQ